MKVIVQLEKQLPDIIGKNVNINNSGIDHTVGHVIEYDKETGVSTMEVDDFIGARLMSSHDIGISSRGTIDINNFYNGLWESI